MVDTSPLRLAVFDCDGTLVDSQASIISSMVAAFEAHSHPTPDAESVRRVVGLPLRVAMGHLLPHTDPDEHAVLENSYKEAFRELRQKGEVADPLYPGTLEVLDALEEEGWLLGVATGKGHLGLMLTLETHGLVNRFQTLQTADSAPGKPDPGMLLNAMRDTGADPENTVMIGDTTFDIEMAVNAGTMAIGVTWGYHPQDHLHSAGAHVIIDEFHVLPETLKNLRGVSK
ncbi:MAG: HAD-IA family hydrolase [Alphaproteobacteria bacterium]|jgi:phosphoglycolate phosphatase|nr:HAD-IA family hydrolase [Alphaproteobacteria bacterium]MBT7942094.1 HAD-IA family hydrolase [Alphaproteobacteria bacterium]